MNLFIGTMTTIGDSMESLLQQLPNGGAVVAIIVVVVLFLRESSQSRHDYLQHLRELTDRLPRPKERP
jgi:hypothetical protein